MRTGLAGYADPIVAFGQFSGRFRRHDDGFSSIYYRQRMLAGVVLPVKEARAQSRVQLYGIVDAALTYTNNIDGGRTWVWRQPAAGNCRRVLCNPLAGGAG